MKLGHGDIDKLCSSSQWLVDQVVSSVQLKVSEELQSHGLSNDIRKSIVDSCASVSGNIFEGLHSRYLREKFYKEEFNYVVRLMYFSLISWHIHVETRSSCFGR
jgi:hypothetical protein